MHIKTLIKTLLQKTSLYKPLRLIKNKTTIYFDKKRRVSGNHKFTVVSAVYNVEKYLDEYFGSLVTQTLKFNEHIYLIMVDDGSTDDSAQIIKKWQSKYPDNITYIKKENGGQASARNLGMESVKTEWVTFIDPDDFVKYDYFETVDRFLTENQSKNFALVACNLLFYYEKNGKIKNTHPLKYKFKETESIFPVSDLQDHIQLSASTAFFNIPLLNKHKNRFDRKIKPTFEDGSFINNYLLQTIQLQDDHFVGFIKNAKYYYRKRSNGSSTLDGAWGKEERYNDQLRYGYLSLLKNADSLFGFVPIYIQRTVLYDVIWYFKRLINHDERINFLSQDGKKTFKDLLYSIFQYIDVETIDNFDLAGIGYMYKMGFIGKYKKQDPEKYIVHLTDYDPIRDEIQLSFHLYTDVEEKIIINDNMIMPRVSKIRKYNFLDELFVYEKILWVPMNGLKGKIKLSICNKPADFFLSKKVYTHGISIEMIRDHFRNPVLSVYKIPKEHLKIRKYYKTKQYKKKYKNAWLLMDRDIQADDNAEHLYRYIAKNYPDINIFFLLRRNSHDWQRLQDKGFRLIDFESTEHKVALLHAKHLISSHADRYVTDYLPKKYYRDILKFNFTFLQHGVIQNDLSNWLNTKKINCFITTSPREYKSLVANKNFYKFTKKEVVLTGLPRHDALLSSKEKFEKTILIMPTWRKSLIGEIIGKSNNRTINNEFSNTSYAHYWKQFLHSQELENLNKKYGFKIIFFPHANIQPYLASFDIPVHIDVLSHNNTSIQKLFQQVSLMITDYSSVAFEMGVLKKEVIYYQFDIKEVFGGDHITEKGYFDYEKDGFGPVCYEESEVWSAIGRFIDNGTTIEQKYLQRIENFFEFNDTNNCQRVFKAIQNLDSQI